jgi:hypothetical protein
MLPLNVVSLRTKMTCTTSASHCRAAKQHTCIALKPSEPAATPSIREAVDTKPSLMPMTAALSHGAPAHKHMYASVASATQSKG